MLFGVGNPNATPIEVSKVEQNNRSRSATEVNFPLSLLSPALVAQQMVRLACGRFAALAGHHLMEDLSRALAESSPSVRYTRVESMRDRESTSFPDDVAIAAQQKHDKNAQGLSPASSAFDHDGS